MTKNATSIWKASRERLGAPDCPLNMSEPQWAVLLFGKVCQVRRFHGFVAIIALGMNNPIELRRERSSQARLWPPASGLYELREGKVSLLIRPLSQLIYVLVVL